MNEFKVNFDKLLEYKLKLDEYFLIWAVCFNKENLVLNYVKSGVKFSNESLLKLQEQDFLTFKKKEKVNFKDLNPTTKSKNMFGISESLTFDKAFEELRAVYPAKTPNKRSLHNDLARCKRLYKELVGNPVDPATHDLIKACAKKYWKELARTRQADYAQLLATWLHQQNYLNYVEEVQKSDHEDTSSQTFETAI